MSKMDELRALREARYEHTLARAAAHRAGTTLPGAARGGVAGPDAPSKAQRSTPPASASGRSASGRSASGQAEPPSTEGSSAEVAEARLCGHRAISGRTCTREHGHAAKSHRYS